jgi:hypothetical protein
VYGGETDNALDYAGERGNQEHREVIDYTLIDPEDEQASHDQVVGGIPDACPESCRNCQRDEGSYPLVCHDCCSLGGWCGGGADWCGNGGTVCSACRIDGEEYSYEFELNYANDESCEEEETEQQANVG